MARKFTPDYDQEMFESMIDDWMADNWEDAETIKVTDISLDDELGWTAMAVDSKDGKVYTVMDDTQGNIILA